MSENNNSPPVEGLDEALDEALAKKETVLRVEAERRLHATKADAEADDAPEDKPPGDHLNPDG